MNHGHCARAALVASLVVSALALAGCMSSPTYGTDKTSSEQLIGDLSNAFSLAPPKHQAIDYKPRPELVKPAPGQKESLPQPQDSITQTASAEWPESPEQRRARLRAEATEHRDDPNFDSPIINDIGVKPETPKQVTNGPGSITTARNSGNDAARKAEINRRLVESQQGDPTSRKYLSEPPLTYRAAADTAPKNDIGEDEYKKERRLKKEAAARSGKSSWGDWWPW